MIPEILNSNAMTLDFLRRLVEDVPDELMTKQPPGVVNHPAWVLGHLIHSMEAIGGEMGLSPWLPSDWKARFGTGNVPSDNRAEYPSKESLLAALADGQHRITKQFAVLGEQGLKHALPDEKHRALFPTIGDAVLHILTAHAALHVGQLTVWRRAAGLGPLMKLFI
ncbi:MAG TPA: DinB family protein [Pirellulales bacterium]|nr:DinB family protein [Pirellulales bacterium]